MQEMSSQKILDLLKKLEELRKAGLISDEEYNEKVKVLLEAYRKESGQTATPRPSTVSRPHPAERKEEKPTRRHTWSYAIAAIAIIIIVVILFAALPYFTTTYGTGKSSPIVIDVTKPDIHVTKIYADTYLAGFDVRARVKAVLHNYGDADGYAVVKLYTIWDTTRDETTRSAFVPAGSSVTVEADLDVPAFSSWRYGAQLISQRKA